MAQLNLTQLHEETDRLKAVNVKLLEALDALESVAYPFATYDSHDYQGLGKACKAARAAIKAAKKG